MLSGIKVGKKKKKRQRVVGDNTQASAELSKSSRVKLSPSNLDAASALRAQLAAGSMGRPSTKSSESGLPYQILESLGRIEKEMTGNNNNVDQNNILVVTGAAAERPDLQREDLRFGSRKGKLKRKAVDNIGTTAEDAEMSIQDMLKAEKEQTQSMDQVYARNIARMGSRFKGRELKNHSSTGADEEDFVDMKVYQEQNLTKSAIAQRETARQVATNEFQKRISAKCWWWMESPSFRKHMLIALGNHVSLVMAPANTSLFPGNHFYLVPVKHFESLVSVDDNVWNEIRRFQISLRKMYAKEGKDVVFTETVFGGSKGFWQTRLQGIPVPKKRNDAPMFFKQAMLEQAEEWGTHNKVLSTREKGLRRTIPNNFSYFFVDWDANDGYAQIIEGTSGFPKDFGADTIAGMLEMDPIRFNKSQRQSPTGEKDMVLQFLDKWKEVDWTTELDS
mmetsp:Transcript_27101/g.41191  ORF Transcript_27101/g.41191 Transcript_27101/m.41191 type:complete len:448 (+) Transcript_27101:80-1423(+)